MDIFNMHKIVFTVGRITPNGILFLGTCFLINKKGTYVTAAHVTDMNDNNLVVVMSNSDMNSYQDTSDLRCSYKKVLIEKIDPICDICILRADVDAYSNIVIGTTDDVNVAENICIVGFPHCTEGRHVLTCQETSVGAKILIEASSVKTKHVVLNIQTRPGQSGSPVFRKSDSRLVAMIIGSYAPDTSGSISLLGINPLTLHQTTHAVSVEDILRMV